MAKFKELIDKIGVFANKNAPTILTCTSVAGLVATAFAAGKAGVRIHYILMEHRESVDSIERHMGGNTIDSGSDALKKAKKSITKETVKEFIPAVLPPVILGGFTVASIISANRISSARYAALGAAYEIARASLNDHKEMIQAVVPKKVDEIEEKIVTKRLEGKKVTEDDIYEYNTNGNQPVFDAHTHVEFRSTRPKIDSAINACVERMLKSLDGTCSLKELYLEMGVPNERIPEYTETVGWHVDDLMNGTLPVIVATRWDKTETLAIIGMNTSSAHYNFEEGGVSSNSFR